MTTHENELPDDELPGAGMFDTDYIRDRLREQEEQGILLWDDENGTYRTSARGIMVGIAMQVAAQAQAINPYAEQDEIMGRVVDCLPWEAKAQMVEELVDDDAAPMPDPDDVGFKVPETLPEGWGDESQ